MPDQPDPPLDGGRSLRLGYGYADSMPIAAVLTVDNVIANRRTRPETEDLGAFRY